jgi:hypothetical protein
MYMLIDLALVSLPLESVIAGQEEGKYVPNLDSTNMKKKDTNQ